MTCAGCATIAPMDPGPSAVERLRDMDRDLTREEMVWAESIDDPWTEPELQLRYTGMQDLCRDCAHRRTGFASMDEKCLCDRVRDPFAIYFNRLSVKVNNLEEQIELKEKAAGGGTGTVAREYRCRPSKENLEKLRSIFEQVHRYYVGWPYTWNRYINKYQFQKARDENFRKAFQDRDREYLALAGRADADPRDVRQARRRAEFAFGRLKEEYITNDLPHAGEVNALYMAHGLDEYHELLRREETLDPERTRSGRRKEVVIFVHGLSETRDSWGRFPILLAHEDTMPGGPADKYFKVYLFSYDTVEDSKSIGGFVRELDGFIKDILAREQVDGVHLIGHSFGAVLGLKYITQEMDPLLGDVDRTDAHAVAARILKAYRGGNVRRTVTSFIAIAGSLSGSEIANIAGDRFIPRERFFRRSLPLFRGGVPGYGDIQVRENQIGSMVNLDSFWKLDTECPLSPEGLLGFLADEEKGVAEPALAALRAAAVPVLCVEGDPVKLQSFLHKEGFLKIDKVLNIFRVDGVITIADSFRREEDDGLVKSYSANINHAYCVPPATDFGYRGAEVRYTDYGHFSICRANSREHHTYRYVTSFLNGSLLPQRDPDHHRIDLFGVLLRATPEGVDILKTPEAYFMPEERVVYSNNAKLVLSPLAVEWVADRDRGNAVWHAGPQWNWTTGVCFYEGRIRDHARSASVTFRLRAEGYEERLVTVPVRPGEVSYAVHVSLKKSGGA
ncbi:MAG: alpha/beta hydrolase [Candidatus Aureabacteria bacterium]|nr:alpha/beta hydrolase [Candidatus Auribacterota bacterium]